MAITHKGFTLIELMIVVAIIGILAVVAIPSYQRYVEKSHINRVVGEISVYRSAFEARAANSQSIDNDSLGYVPSSLTTGDFGIEIVTVNPDGSGHLQVTMGVDAYPTLVGTIIRYERSVEGLWSCVIDKSAAAGWPDTYQPRGCTVL